MKKVFFLNLILFLAMLTGCTKKEINEEKFMLGITIDDRVIHFSFDVPYKDKLTNSFVLSEMSNNHLSVQGFLENLRLINTLKDGGSKIYEYDITKKVYGNNKFYAIECNSIDGINDIFVAKNKESLDGLCSIKIDDLEGVSMSIKEGTLTSSGATIIIYDISGRDNIYGESYRIDRKVNGVWNPIETKTENYAFTAIGYKVGNDHKLELDINWQWLYGNLDYGDYRIVKDTSKQGERIKHYITTEFTID